MSCCFIKEYSNFLDKEKLKEIKNHCKEASTPASIVGPVPIDTKVRNVLVASTTDKDYSFSNIYASLLWSKTKEYLESIKNLPCLTDNFFESIFRIEPISYLKYKPGYFYKTHSDEAFLFPAQPDFFRELSYVFFVNEDFSGGALHFPNQNKVIKPRENTLIIFPSNWCFPHEVLPVTRGVRHTAVTWGGRIIQNYSC